MQLPALNRLIGQLFVHWECRVTWMVFPHALSAKLFCQDRRVEVEVSFELTTALANYGTDTFETRKGVAEAMEEGGRTACWFKA
jgi:hypothetical protein